MAQGGSGSPAQSPRRPSRKRRIRGRRRERSDPVGSAEDGSVVDRSATGLTSGASALGDELKGEAEPGIGAGKSGAADGGSRGGNSRGSARGGAIGPGGTFGGAVGTMTEGTIVVPGRGSVGTFQIVGSIPEGNAIGGAAIGGVANGANGPPNGPGSTTSTASIGPEPAAGPQIEHAPTHRLPSAFNAQRAQSRVQ